MRAAVFSNFESHSNPLLIFLNERLIFSCYNDANKFREARNMTNFEMVEKLCEKANVTYEEARAALEQTDWDLLDAIVLLEQQGKVNKNSARHSTREEPLEAEPMPERENFSSHVSKFWKTVARIIRIGNENHLVISRKGEQVLTLPVTALALLLLFAHVFLLVALVVGLFFGLRYSFKGEQLGRDSVNSAMKKAADMAECMKESVEEELKL